MWPQGQQQMRELLNTAPKQTYFLLLFFKCYICSLGISVPSIHSSLTVYTTHTHVLNTKYYHTTNPYTNVIITLCQVHG